MKMRKLPFILLSVLVLCGGLYAQTECPKISLTGPSGITEPGGPITFTAPVEPAGADLKYQWSISSGQIIEGQGTPAIKVMPETKRDGFNLTVTVEIAGLPAGCPNTMSETAGLAIDYKLELLDEFRGPVAADDDAELRFKSLEIRLRNEADSKAVIVLYCKNARQRETDKRTILKYIHPFVRSRILFVNGPDQGSRPFIKVWLVPVGAQGPAI